MNKLDLDDLRAELEDFAQPEKKSGASSREERIIAGFEEIQRFATEHGRAPQHGEERDIFERLYAVRLDRLRASEESRSLLASLDHQGLLSNVEPAQAMSAEAMDNDKLLAELEGAAGASDISELRHVRSRVEIRAAEEIANREKCEDFKQFAPLFDEAESGLKTGLWITKPFAKDAGIKVGDFFIVGGQTAYVAEMSADATIRDGRENPRLRVIFSNKTESNLLLRSLSRSLYPDGDQPVGRRLIKVDEGPLFSQNREENDIESGTIYVLRSLSNEPFVAEHRELIHKIGVTGGKVEIRIANAANDATYLLADVEVVASYKLVGVNRAKLEGIFHRIFAAAQIDLTIHDRFGHPVKPREWFLVPLSFIDEAVRRIVDGSITEMVYDPKTATLIKQRR